jgi:transposase
VDEFAVGKGRVYGTVIADAESGEVVDLLPGREAATLQAWLRARPGAEVICRDRAGACAEGAAVGAPVAIQVAGCWHLWHNLGGYVEKAVVAHRLLVKATSRESRLDPFKAHINQRWNEGITSAAALARRTSRHPGLERQRAGRRTLRPPVPHRRRADQGRQESPAGPGSPARPEDPPDHPLAAVPPGPPRPR